MQAVARKHNATLVAYSLIYNEQLLLIWVVTATDVKFERVYLNQQPIPLNELIISSREALGGRNRGGFTLAYSPEIEADNLGDLYELLIAPIQEYLPEDEHTQVIFIPQGKLFLVPFPALQADDRTYLIQHHTISTAPSIQILDLTYQKRLAQNMLGGITGETSLIVGNPISPEISLSPGEAPRTLASLPGAELEAREIASTLGGNALIGASASETIVKQAMPDMRLIHLATHGLLEFGQVSSSQEIPGAIVFTSSLEDDGLLTASELLSMSLNADLVVLSACDTGQGDIRGDGVIGLSRSLISAGTPSIIVSLWSVPDAPTSQLMIAFYNHLLQGELNKAQALRQAMLETLEIHSDPRDWAAFTLIGQFE